MDIRKRVDKIYAAKALLDKELDELRKNCLHTRQTASIYSWRIGCMQPAQFCADCDKMLGDCSPEDAERIWKGIHGEARVYSYVTKHNMSGGDVMVAGSKHYNPTTTDIKTNGNKL